ncbi:hypothetical protein SASPL_133686 [Salvia splendens]|uniref:Uncharacterized protein n=1 Tax=Salvia splendens TaxID=180675 RepID=A0A8X8X4R5_SALSN|nr:hypothetical protein SASPL_133686 [Salvia splendens]
MNTNRIKRAIYRDKERKGLRSFGKLASSTLARSPVTSNGLNPGYPEQEKLKKLISSSNLDHTDTKPSSLHQNKIAKQMANAKVAEAILRLEMVVDKSQGGERPQT